MATTPRGREKNVTGQGKDVYKRGDGLGTGPVGSSDGYAGKPTGGSSGQGGSAPKRSGGSGGLLKILIGLLVLGGGGTGLGALFGGGGGTTQPTQYVPPTQYVAPTQQQQSTTDILSALFGGGNSYSFAGASSSTGSLSQATSTSSLNTAANVGNGKRYTEIKGNGRDEVTIMVYMCGTDLESGNGMATLDLKEMAKAAHSSKVHLIVFTGGCKQWRTNGISNTYNQIYEFTTDGKFQCLESNYGKSAMTKSSTLAGFIQYCAARYPKANRNELIFWDHGGGSVTGYGYDEKNPGSSSMSLAGIRDALRDGGVKFDIIGFDACLMATTENALMLSEFGDYMVASEETEPGTGWYYTNWLTVLSNNTSTSSLEIGKKIVDDFVDVCAQSCRGQAATLSVVDLLELKNTVPEGLKNFAISTTELLENNQYKTVANARSSAREFASSSRIDQVDLIDLAKKIGTAEAKELANILTSAVKYNRHSSNMTNANGLSIYFPYKKISTVDSAVNTFESIGVEDEYCRCIERFASIGTSGQAVSGGAASPLSALLSGYSSGTSTASTSDTMTNLLSGLLTGNYNSVSGLSSLTSAFLGRSMPTTDDVKRTAIYLAENRFASEDLIWTKQSDGKYGIYLPDEQWLLVDNLLLNVFYDDGAGYIDLGLDNVFSINEYGVLSGEYDGTWLAINDQPVAYYYVDSVFDGDKYEITGRIPVMLNEARADLIVVFTDEQPNGYIAGARYDYKAGETDAIAKALTEIAEKDEIDFLCDYYSYAGKYLDSYKLGDHLTVGKDGLTISNVYLPDASKADPSYVFTDIYQQQYWTPVIPKQ